jgi:hypothetical protein
MIRNRLVIGGWFPISLQGGKVLYQGNNPYTQTALTRLRDGERGWYDDPRWGAGFEGLPPLEADRLAFRLAIAHMREHPAVTLGYSAQKAQIFFRAYSHPAAQVSWYPVLALSLLGFLWTAGRWRELMPLYLLILQTLLVAAMYTSMPRFRSPVEPFFVLMAAVALNHLRDRKPFVGWLRKGAVP